MNTGQVLLAVDGIVFGMVLYCVAAGFTISYSAGVFNLAHGSVFAAGTYAAAVVMDSTWAGLGWAIVYGCAAGAVAGVVLAVLLRPIHEPLDQALATIGVGLAIGFILTRTFGGHPLLVSLPAALDRPVMLLGQHYPLYRLALAAVAAAMAAGSFLLMHRTKAGLLVRAAADNPRLLSLHRVEPKTVLAVVLAAASVVAAVSGVCAAALFPPAPGTGHRIMVLSLVVAIAGGPGSLRGALLAALAVGQMHTTVVAWWPQAAAFLPYLLLIAALTATAVIRRRQAGRLRP